MKRDALQNEVFIKVWIFWEGHKIWKNLPLKIWRYSLTSNFKCSNFVAFSEYPNITAGSWEKEIILAGIFFFSFSGPSFFVQPLVHVKST